MGRRGMHGNHQNWKGNKGVPEGAPLSLHGGCLATPASRSLPTPRSLLTPSALTPSQPFPSNHRRTLPVPLFGIHFTFFSSLPVPSAHHSRIRTTEYRCSLFLPWRNPPCSRILGPSTLSTPSASSARAFSVTLFSVWRCTSERTSGFYSPPGNCTSSSPSAHLQPARVYPLPWRASLTFCTFSLLACI